MRLIKDQPHILLTLKVMYQRQAKYYNQHNKGESISITVTAFFIMDQFVFFVKAHNLFNLYSSVNKIVNIGQKHRTRT